MAGKVPPQSAFGSAYTGKGMTTAPQRRPTGPSEDKHDLKWRCGPEKCCESEQAFLNTMEYTCTRLVFPESEVLEQLPQMSEVQGGEFQVVLDKTLGTPLGIDI